MLYLLPYAKYDTLQSVFEVAPKREPWHEAASASDGPLLASARYDTSTSLTDIDNMTESLLKRVRDTLFGSAHLNSCVAQHRGSFLNTRMTKRSSAEQA